MKPYKWRLYADHNIEREIVQYLREDARMDVLWVQEEPKLRQQQDDIFHYHEARRLRRYLLTYDQDFWDDARFPLNQSPGVIILVRGSEAKYLVHVFEKLLTGFGEVIYLDAMKIRLTAEGFTIKFVDRETQKKHTSSWQWRDVT